MDLRTLAGVQSRAESGKRILNTNTKGEKIMGCDIHCYAEKKTRCGYKVVLKNAFDYRDYGLFGFLADVRNYSNIPPISIPRGLPQDVSLEVKSYTCLNFGHSYSWLSVKELADYDYDFTIEDRRCTVEVEPGFLNGGVTCDKGEGVFMTVRAFLGPHYFKKLNEIIESGADRIVFWFDS